MAAAYLITFREGLEAALIIGILLSCLRALKMNQHQIYVWGGVVAGLILSLIFAWAFSLLLGGFEGKSEKIYEGLLMIGAAGLITHLIVWMRIQGRQIAEHLKTQVELSVKTGMLWSIAFIALFSVVREGIETVIFFQALSVQSNGALPFISGGAGVFSAVVLAVVIFYTTKKIPINEFFRYTSYFLILISAGLLAHGVVELQAAGWIPTYIKPLYDLSAILPETTGLGSFLKAGFGYDANPSLIAVMTYVTYLGIFGAILRRR